MKVQLMAVLMIAVVTANAIPHVNLYYSGYSPAETTQLKRSGGPTDPEWNQLGWAWGKRSVGLNEVPRRLIRAIQAVKKNPDWQDLGFAWGRK